MAHPAIGETVHVWPHPGRPVRSHDPAILARYFPDDGTDLPWSQWLEELHGQGHVHLSDPRPQCSIEKARALAEAHAAQEGK